MCYTIMRHVVGRMYQLSAYMHGACLPLLVRVKQKGENTCHHLHTNDSRYCPGRSLDPGMSVRDYFQALLFGRGGA